MGYPPGVINVNAPLKGGRAQGIRSFPRRTPGRISPRTGKRGKPKNVRIDIEADDFIVDTRATQLNTEFAGVIQAIIDTEWDAIRVDAAPATIARRQRAATTGQDSKWYRQRYAGGQIGELQPGQTDQLFKDSLRMRRTTVRMRNRSTGAAAATINFPANRADPTTFGKGFDAMMRRLGELVPILGGRFTSKTREMLRTANSNLLDGLIAMSEKRYRALKARRARVIRQIIRGFGLNADAFAFTQQLRLQRGVRQGMRTEKRTLG